MSAVLQVREFRVGDQGDLLADIAAEATSKNLRTKVAIAEAKFYTTKPLSAQNYCALREHFVRRARAADADRVIDDAVTPVASLRRGARPVDVFTIMDDDIINELVGDGALALHLSTNRAATKIVPPMDFFLKARRDEAGNLLAPKELVVKAHVVALVPDHGNPGHPLFRIDHVAFEYPEEDVMQYSRALAGALLRAAAAPNPGLSAEFRAWSLRTLGQA